ncbi:hypothetical protein [Azonexus sp.]|uniref:hypothetical protein n=1 Tax=Azonexus sp. TaxID=1872668 RepID=UPI0035AF4825
METVKGLFSLLALAALLAGLALAVQAGGWVGGLGFLILIGLFKAAADTLAAPFNRRGG